MPWNPPSLPPSVEAQIPEEIDALCLKAMAKNPADRYQSMAEFAEAVERVLQSQEEAPPSTQPAGGGSKTRSRGWLLAAMALSLTLLAGVVLYVATDRGAIVINSPDANIQIEIRRHGEDGGEIYRLDAGKNRFSFRSDKYEVVVKGADADQYRIENGDIRLSRGDEELVSIKRLPANSEATAASKTEAFTSEQQAFFDHVASLPGEKQVEAVKQKLIEINPGFDGNLASKIENDHVVELQFLTDHVTQIWPVRALTHLRELTCEGSDVGKGRLEDLSPLQGLSLTSLECGKTRVSDLTPLKNMPLARLGCNGTNVSDLSPLTEAATRRPELWEHACL